MCLLQWKVVRGNDQFAEIPDPSGHRYQVELIPCIVQSRRVAGLASGACKLRLGPFELSFQLSHLSFVLRQHSEGTLDGRRDLVPLNEVVVYEVVCSFGMKVDICSCYSALEHSPQERQ